mgnify:CR=1 FL=1
MSLTPSNNNFTNRGKDIKYYALNALYPIGSFYVQFPVKGSNRTSEAFLAAYTPAVLFGGDWQEQWKYESVFFKSISPALIFHLSLKSSIKT